MQVFFYGVGGNFVDGGSANRMKEFLNNQSRNMETHIYVQLAGIVLLLALFGLLAMWNVYTTSKYFTHAENKPSPSPLSSLKVGDYFIIVDDEEDLWEILYFGWQDVFVSSVRTGRTEWLKYDLKIQKFPYSRLNL